MNEIERKEIYLKALAVYGSEMQLNQAIEEMAELTVAIRHFLRCRPNNLIEELADVSVMIEQISLLFGKDAIEAVKKIKIKRLERRLMGKSILNNEPWTISEIVLARDEGIAFAVHREKEPWKDAPYRTKTYLDALHLVNILNNQRSAA
ncbi:MAG: hypothetical protein AB7U85_04775 [Alphaproteobacteria bacterium]